MSVLSTLKPLTTDQYDQARAKAIERVKARIGTRPTRDQFKRELGALWSALDVLALIVFVAALLVSSAHIITHMGMLASLSYNSAIETGIVLPISDYTIIHQIGMILLAEASMLLFMVMHGMRAREREGRAWWSRHFSLPLLLALIAATFVFVANWQSGIGLLEALMPPVFTVGIGLHLERLIVAGLHRREEITRRYLEALHIYEHATEDPTKHPEFLPVLRQEIWARLVSLPTNKEFRDAPPSVKHAAVRRELERDHWAYVEDAPEVGDDWQPPPALNGGRVNGKKRTGETPMLTATDTQPVIPVNGDGAG